MKKCKDALKMLQGEFSARFHKLRANGKEIRVFQNPFGTDINDARPPSNSNWPSCILKDAFKADSVIEFRMMQSELRKD